MSIRKVSDLPFLDIVSQDKEQLSNIDDSLMEISYLSSRLYDSDGNAETRTYVSRASELSSFKTYILKDILENSNVILSGTKIFTDDVQFLSGVDISDHMNLEGDLIVNEDVIYPSTRTFIKNDTNTIVGQTKNVLSAPSIQIFADTVEFNSYSDETNTQVVVLSSNDTMVMKKSPVIKELTSDILENPSKAVTVQMFNYLSSKIKDTIDELGTMAYMNHYISTTLPSTLSANTFYFIVEG